MSNWSLPVLLESLHSELESRLKISRKSFGHPSTKGDATEGVWLALLNDYLPKRYQVAKANVVDSRGAFSDQIDIVIFDRQYSPFIFTFGDSVIVPAESVYAVFEAKQSINSVTIDYAHKKTASVRRLHRTSLPIPHAGGTFPAKALSPILAGIVSLESDWSPAMGSALTKVLNVADHEQRLDMGCVAAHGVFAFDGETQSFAVNEGGKAASVFLFSLISRLQKCATVPMIDIDAYATWIGHHQG